MEPSRAGGGVGGGSGGLPAFQEVQMPSSGRWAALSRKDAGSFRSLWKPAQEAIQSLLL